MLDQGQDSRADHSVVGEILSKRRVVHPVRFDTVDAAPDGHLPGAMQLKVLSSIDHLVDVIEGKHAAIVPFQLSQRRGAPLEVPRKPPLSLAGGAVAHDALAFVFPLADGFLGCVHGRRDDQAKHYESPDAPGCECHSDSFYCRKMRVLRWRSVIQAADRRFWNAVSPA